MNDKTAIVCMAYGTNPNGTGPSPMMRAVTAEASMLAKAYPTFGGFILQGGYRVDGGPMESELMDELLEDFKEKHQFHLEATSTNTIEGAREILAIAAANSYDHLVIIDQKIHHWRVRYTFQKVFKRWPHIELEFVSVSSPFGGNSQKRLNSAWNWWLWEIRARIVTYAILH